MKKVLLILLAVSLFGKPALAGSFDSGLPAGWVKIGNAGTLGADGVVTLAPNGGSKYGYVSTNGGVIGNILPGIGGTNGSSLTSTVFTAGAGSSLKFSFDYITSDGAGYADYAYAELLNAANSSVVATIFTARTTPNGNSVPGFGLPAISAITNPSTVTIHPGTIWSALGASSGQVYSTGAGNSGWVQSDYTIANAGNYLLKFGVANWQDTAYDSGLAFDGLTIDNRQIGGPAPEPSTYALMGIGGLLVAFRLKKSAQKSAVSI